MKYLVLLLIFTGCTSKCPVILRDTELRYGVTVKQSEDFEKWFSASSKALQDEILEKVEVLREVGPVLGRPLVDTIIGSTISNLKELRFNCGKMVVRIFFVFDPDRNAVLLIGGDKAGLVSKTFYNRMISMSEDIYSKYLEARKKEIEKEQKKLVVKKEKDKKTKKKKKT